MIRNYKYRLYLTKNQENTLIDWSNKCKLVWNLALKQRELAFHWSQTHEPIKYEDKKGKNGKITSVRIRNLPSEYDQSAELTLLKKEFRELYSVPSGTLCNVLTMLDLSYKLFFKNLKNNPDRAGKPKYKGRMDSIGLKFKDREKKIEKLSGGYARINLDKLGSVRFRAPKIYEGKIKNCLVKQEPDGWYICMATEIEDQVFVRNKATSAIGIDWGVKNWITLSDGRVFNLPEQKGLQQKIAQLQRFLSKKKKGSSSYRKTVAKIAKLKRAQSRGLEYHSKLVASQLTRANGLIGMEDLKVSNMTKSAKGTVENPGKNVASKSGLNREILKKIPAKTADIFKYMGQKNGCEVVFVNPKNTSRKCSNCGYVDKENRKTQEKFECVKCGFLLQADKNAAKNIVGAALAVYLPAAESRGGEHGENLIEDFRSERSANTSGNLKI